MNHRSTSLTVLVVVFTLAAVLTGPAAALSETATRASDGGASAAPDRASELRERRPIRTQASDHRARGLPATRLPNSTATNSTNPATAPTVAGDPKTHIVDYWMQNGQMHVELYAERVVSVSVSAPPSSTSGQAGGYVRQTVIQTGQLQEVVIPAPTGTVWISTTRSVENGRFTQLSTDSGALIAGPFDSNDAILAGTGGALGVALMVLFKAIQAYHGQDQRGDRVA